MGTLHFVYLFTHEWTLVLFPPLALVNNAAVNMCPHVSV